MRGTGGSRSTTGARHACHEGPVGWERRGSGVYYYHRERVAGRLVGRYFGRGPDAVLAEQLDLEGRAERALDAEEVREAREADLVLDGALDAFARGTDVEAVRILRALGFHRPGRNRWRLRREGCMTDEKGPADPPTPDWSKADVVALRRAADAGAPGARDAWSDRLKAEPWLLRFYGDLAYRTWSYLTE